MEMYSIIKIVHVERQIACNLIRVVIDLSRLRSGSLSAYVDKTQPNEGVSRCGLDSVEISADAAAGRGTVNTPRRGHDP